MAMKQRASPRTFVSVGVTKPFLFFPPLRTALTRPCPLQVRGVFLQGVGVWGWDGIGSVLGSDG